MRFWKGGCQFPAFACSSGGLGEGWAWALSEIDWGWSLSCLLLGGWISCTLPGHRGDTEQEAEKKLKRAGGTREDTVQQARSDQGKLNCTWAQHVRHKYSSLVSAQLGRALFCFLKECCQFLFGWQIFALFKKEKKKKKEKVVVVFFFSPHEPRANNSH